ncbi:MAG TPA: hypothetical protein VF881_03845 [Polyangiaceae bacterium]
MTGYHRKHAIRTLNRVGMSAIAGTVTRSRLYGEAVREALVVLWEASDRVCAKRLRPLLPLLVPALERHGHLQLEQSVRALVLSASPATIDRILVPTRRAIHGGRRGRRASPGVRRSVPVRTFADWDAPPPGFVEADLVGLCTSSPAQHRYSTFMVVTSLNVLPA